MPIVKLSEAEEKSLKEKPESPKVKTLLKDKNICTQAQFFEAIKQGNIDKLSYPKFYVHSCDQNGLTPLCIGLLSRIAQASLSCCSKMGQIKKPKLMACDFMANHISCA